MPLRRLLKRCRRQKRRKRIGKRRRMKKRRRTSSVYPRQSSLRLCAVGRLGSHRRGPLSSPVTAYLSATLSTTASFLFVHASAPTPVAVPPLPVAFLARCLCTKCFHASAGTRPVVCARAGALAAQWRSSPHCARTGADALMHWRPMSLFFPISLSLSRCLGVFNRLLVHILFTRPVRVSSRNTPSFPSAASTSSVEIGRQGEVHTNPITALPLS